MFGQLERRFPVLANTIRVLTENIPKMVSACVVLYNVSKFLNDPGFDGNTDDQQEEFEEEEEYEEVGANVAHRRGMSRRKNIAAAIRGVNVQF